MNTEKVYFHHIRNVKDSLPTGKGGVTVAFKQESPSLLVWAHSQCHPNDNFNKRIGRVKSSGRLKSNEHIQFFSFETPIDLETVEGRTRAIKFFRDIYNT